MFGGGLYDEEGDTAPQAALEASLGCGVSTAVAYLHEGETVLDLGIDVHETHRVHEHASSAIVRARKPAQ